MVYNTNLDVFERNDFGLGDIVELDLTKSFSLTVGGWLRCLMHW